MRRPLFPIPPGTPFDRILHVQASVEPGKKPHKVVRPVLDPDVQTL